MSILTAEPTRALLIEAFKLRYASYGLAATVEVDALLGVLEIAQLAIVQKSALTPPAEGEVAECIGHLRNATEWHAYTSWAATGGGGLSQECKSPFTAANLLTRLSAECARLKADNAVLHEEADDLQGQLDDALAQPWPKWAERILAHLKAAGMEFDRGEEIDLPGTFIDHVCEWVRGIERDAAKKVSAAQRERDEAVAEIARLRELAFNIAKAAVPEWKKEFQRAAQFEEKLASMNKRYDDAIKEPKP